MSFDQKKIFGSERTSGRVLLVGEVLEPQLGVRRADALELRARLRIRRRRNGGVDQDLGAVLPIAAFAQIAVGKFA